MSATALPRQSDRSKYPGMRPREGEIFRRWLRLHEHEYAWFSYNVRVGPGRPLPAEFSAATQATAIASSQKRIDAVVWAGARATLVEVKDYATQTAIGQILEYAALWQSQNPQEKPPALLIVCTGGEPTFLPAAVAAGIQVDYVSNQ